MRAEPQALEHGALLLERIVIARAVAEAIAEILVVYIRSRVIERLLRMDALHARIWVGPERAGTRRGEPSRATVAGEIALGEDLDEVVVAVALDRAGVAHACGLVRRITVVWRGVAGQTREDALLEGTERISAGIEGLETAMLARSTLDAGVGGGARRASPLWRQPRAGAGPG